MKLSPAARRALHEALDLVLDALAEEQSEPAKKTRTRAQKERKLPEGVDDMTIARAIAAGRKAGLL